MRVKGIFKPADYPADPDGKPGKEITELFDHLFPGVESPEIDRNHAGIALAAHNPKLALHFAQLSRFLALDTSWCQRADLRELAIQTVNHLYGSDYSFQARLPNARAAGINDALLAELPGWRTSPAFDEEQRLVIEYVQAVVSGEVPTELFSAIVRRYGEKGAIECTAVIAFWSAWAMLINAAGPERDSGS